MKRKKEMNKITIQIKNCKNCELFNGRKNAVVGEGNLESSVVFIGEAPGKKEDELGKPFVGSAGNLLDQMLNSVGLNRNEIFITNIVKCRPPGNRRPKSNEIKACSDHLQKQLNALKPKILVPLGNSATKHLMKLFGLKWERIGQIHGDCFKAEASWGSVILYPLYHPAGVLYNRNLEEELIMDFKKLKKLFDDCFNS